MAGRSIIMLSAAALLALAVGIIDESVLLPAVGGTAVELPEPPSRQTPLQQLRDGVPLREISCTDGMVLMQRDKRSVCVYPGTVERLEARGWDRVVLANPSHVLTQSAMPDAGGISRSAVYAAPQVPLIANTTLTISKIPSVNDTATLTLTTTYPTDYCILNKYDDCVRVDYLDNETTTASVGFELSSSLHVVKLDPRLDAVEVINEGPDYNNRTYLESMTELVVKPGRTYVFNATIQPVREGHMGLSAYGFFGDRMPLEMSVGNDTAVLRIDYKRNNHTYLEHLDRKATGSVESIPLDLVPISDENYVHPPPLADEDLEGIYLHIFTSDGGPEYTVQSLVDEILHHGKWDEDRIRLFLTDVLDLTDEEVGEISIKTDRRD